MSPGHADTGTILGMAQPPTHARFIVVTFMVAFAMVTYLDRACIGAMASSISKDFGLDEAQMSWVFFSFILAYAIFEIPTARYADRHGAKNTLTRIVSWWSAFTLLTASAWNYASLLVTRFLFGMGEAGAWPCVARVFSRWIPMRERATVKGIFFAGAYAAGAITTALVIALLPHFSWRQILVAFGCIGVVWVAFWRSWFRDDPALHPSANDAERAVILADRPADAPHLAGWDFWRRLLGNRDVQLLCLLYMPNCATFYFCITWLPSYLEKAHGFAKGELGIYASLPLFAAIATQFLGGFCSDVLVKRLGLRAGRRIPGVVGYLLAAVAIVAVTLVPQRETAAILIAVAAAVCMITTAPAWSTCIDIGREHSATVGAAMNTSGQIAAILSQPIIGYSVKMFGDWNAPFWLLGGLFLVGALCWCFVDPRRPLI